MRKIAFLPLAFILITLPACESPLSRGRETLGELLNPGSHKITLVYSRWTVLTRNNGLRFPYLLQMLSFLRYRRVPSPAALRPGDYAGDYPDLYIYTKPFRYPDQAYPAQWIHLSFRQNVIDSIETLPQKTNLDLWRLEPVQIAAWGSLPGANRPRIVLADLPPHIPKAIVAIEDKRFYQHGAFDWVGILRALWVDLRHGGIRQGASTISQQLARSVFLNVNRTWKRKFSEALIALYLEVRFSKEQLLEMYLNQVYWGEDGGQTLLGLAAASRSYFGKPAHDLSVGEAAALAGILQSPNRYSPRAYPEIALARRNLVLSLMKDQGFISADDYQKAEAQPLKLAPLEAQARETPYFAAFLQNQLSEKYSLPVLLTKGWTIFTTLDPVLQHDAVTALRPAAGQAAMVAIEPPSGAIRAWVGGVDYARNPFDRVVRAKRQPGSAFKPFVVLAAIDTRTAAASTRLEDKPLTIKLPGGDWARNLTAVKPLDGAGGNMVGWSPQNFDKKFRSEVSVREALVNSYNVPMVRLAMKTGLGKVAEYARRCGITSPLKEVPSLALGTSETTALELTSAYSTLANEGRYNPPYYIETILDPDGHTFETHLPDMRNAVSPESAFLVTSMLQDVLKEGTGKASSQMGLDIPAAGKTGTSVNFQDAWFVGYTPNLACGVWAGFDHPASLGRSAAGIALPLWVSFMKQASSQIAMLDFAAPSELIEKTIDTDTGFSARSGCPHRRREFFLPGTMPPECPVHPGGVKGFFSRIKKWPENR
jgi:penicillin-binding protein 1B